VLPKFTINQNLKILQIKTKFAFRIEIRKGQLQAMLKKCRPAIAYKNIIESAIALNLKTAVHLTIEISPMSTEDQNIKELTSSLS
jgi:ACT domain-containing protein